MRSRIAMASLLAFLAAACAGSAWIPRGHLAGFHATEAAGARIVGDLTPDELRSLAGDLARFDALFARLAGWPAQSSSAPLAVFLLRDRELARRFELGRGVAGWALGTLDGSFISVMISSGGDEDRNTLLHEVTHVLLRKNRRAPLPRWYNEGLATYFSTVYERDGTMVVGSAPGTLAARVANRGALPLDRLFAGSSAPMRPDEVVDFYATSWALSHYLLSSPSRRRELSAFVQQLARGVPGDEALRTAFGRPVERLGAELAVHVGHLARGVAIETLIDTRDLAAPDPAPVVSLDPGEAAYALGCLALAMLEEGGADAWEKGPALAQNFFALALAEDASDARSEAALGEALALGGDGDGALAAVQRAAERAPEDPLVRLHAARVALLRAEAEPDSPSGALAAAEAQYRRALALDPDSASAWFGLGRTLVRMGRSEDAFAAFETARRFGWSEPLDVALARIHLERGERERAADLLRPIVQDPHAGPAQQEAALLLEQTLP